MYLSFMRSNPHSTRYSDYISVKIFLGHQLFIRENAEVRPGGLAVVLVYCRDPTDVCT